MCNYSGRHSLAFEESPLVFYWRCCDASFFKLTIKQACLWLHTVCWAALLFSSFNRERAPGLFHRRSQRGSQWDPYQKKPCVSLWRHKTRSRLNWVGTQFHFWSLLSTTQPGLIESLSQALLPVLTSAKSCIHLQFFLLIIGCSVLCHGRMTLAGWLFIHSQFLGRPWIETESCFKMPQSSHQPSAPQPPQTTLIQTCHFLSVLTTPTFFPRSI